MLDGGLLGDRLFWNDETGLQGADVIHPYHIL